MYVSGKGAASIGAVRALEKGRFSCVAPLLPTRQSRPTPARWQAMMTRDRSQFESTRCYIVLANLSMRHWLPAGESIRSRLSCQHAGQQGRPRNIFKTVLSPPTYPPLSCSALQATFLCRPASSNRPAPSQKGRNSNARCHFYIPSSLQAKRMGRTTPENLLQSRERRALCVLGFLFWANDHGQ